MIKEETGEFEFNEASAGFKELYREYSPCGRVVMIVGLRPDNNYTYSIHFWDLSEKEYIGSGYWAPSSTGGLFSDIDSAIKEAKQTLETNSIYDEK